ncbi:hypothetical protein [Methanoculleus bourgensis]|jgi:hypothetical protein|uniref:hypothetical protein n=1 Tax=Methanoculleus bourgensis TaxID=83986 RepID=UPI0024900F09|nr:hypothetical protein [Methanoculleus bourgensis]
MSQERKRLPCIYCGVPNVNVRYEKTNENTQFRFSGVSFGDFSIGEILASRALQYSETAIPHVSCRNCGRTYWLLADCTADGYINKLLSIMAFSGTVCEGMVAHDLEVSNITEGFLGVSKTSSFWDEVKRKINNKNETHIVFQAEHHRYFISCYFTNGQQVAVNMERVL